MERLVEQLVAWHNRHPLALRITPGDVHTLGVVALPFMRNSRPLDASEPTLTDEISEEEALARAADAATQASATKAALPTPRQPWWKPFDPRALFANPAQGLLGDLPWPVFSERFIPGLRPAQVANFALAHGYTSQPGEADWPQRIVAIDEALVAKASQGAWPMELYLASAGIDVGKRRSRVLIGQGNGSELLLLGRRCLDRRRLALVGLLLTCLVAGSAWLLWPAQQPGLPAPALPSAASAPAPASAPASGADASTVPASAVPAPAAPPSSEAASAPMPTPAIAAAPPASAPSPAAAAASAPLPEPRPEPKPAPAETVPRAGVSASELPNELAPPGTIPSIRPNMVSTPRTRKAAAEAADYAASQAARQAAGPASTPSIKPETPAKASKPMAAAEKPAEKSPEKSADKSAEKSAERLAAKVAGADKPDTASGKKPDPAHKPPPAGTLSGEAPSEAAKAATAQLATRGQTVVALVGPSLANKADAEAMLERMRGMVAQTVGDRTRLQAQVFQTPEGWRAAIWPFATREEAQLINATLIARGMRTRAVDF